MTNAALDRYLGRIPTRSLAGSAAAGWVRAHPVVASALLALAVRLLVAGVIAAVHDGHLFLDDQTYHQMAAARAEGSDATWDPYTSWLYQRTATYLVPVTALYWALGTHVLLGQLVSVLFGVAAVAGVAALGAKVGGPRLGLVAGGILALLPSQVLWSSLTLKDAAVWASVVGLALAVRAAGEARTPRALVRGLTWLLLLTVLLGHLRLHSLVVAVWAAVLASSFGAGRYRGARTAAVVGIALLAPLVMDAGLGGAHVVRGFDDLSEARTANAVGANTPISRPDAPTGDSGTPTSSPSVDEPVAFEDELADNARHLPRGLVAVALRPFPWESGDGTAFRAARWEAVLWYPLLVLAALGLHRARRRWRSLLFPVLYAGGALLVYALAEGNIGTAFRHRAELAWVVVLLAAMALVRPGATARGDGPRG